MKAPAIPTAIDDEAVEAAVAGFPAAANILPSVPHYPAVTVASDAMVAELRLTGQGSTARAELSFRYDAIHITEPELPVEVKRFVKDRWLVVKRNIAAEIRCAERLTKGGLRQVEPMNWTWIVQSLFAHISTGPWLKLQRGLFRDLEFEGWNYVIDEDFGFRPDVIASKESAETERRVNRGRRTAV
jgi:hypothetical protein